MKIKPSCNIPDLIIQEKILSNHACSITVNLQKSNSTKSRHIINWNFNKYTAGVDVLSLSRW
jgi:hypothetical protein